MQSFIEKFSRDSLSNTKQSEESNLHRIYNENSREEKDNSNKVIVDLDLIVEKWISYMWDKTKTKQQSSKFEFEDMKIVVNWSKVEITQEEAKFESETNRKLKSQILFKTFFTNTSKSEQQYSFQTERTTRQSCCFSFYKGFSSEKESGITFKLPQEVIEIGSGIKQEQSVELGKDQTNEEILTWSVNSIIKVPPFTKTCASLSINEAELERNFILETKIKGRIIVELFNKKQNNQFEKSFSGDLVEIISNAIEKFWIPPKSNIFEVLKEEKYARAILRGKCQFKLGVEQFVDISEQKL